MSHEVFSKTLQKTHLILNEMAEKLGLENQANAYIVLRSMLHTLRDRIPADVAVSFASQLPMLVRGFFFEGWDPSRNPIKFSKDEFINEIGEKIPFALNYSLEEMFKVTMQIIQEHTTEGEINKIKKILPKEFQDLFG